MTTETVGTAGPLLEGIRASAGAGKTYSLTTRFLRAFCADGAPRAEEILATTFTRAAAGEILGRVLRRLAEACDDDAKRARLSEEVGLAYCMSESQAREHLAKLCASLDRVAISTIDSVFGRIAGAYPLETGISADFERLDSDCPAAQRIRLGAVRTLLDNGDRKELLSLLSSFEVGSPIRVISALTSMLETLLEVYESAPDAGKWRLSDVPSALPDDQVQFALAHLSSLEGVCANKSQANALCSDVEKAGRADWAPFMKAGLAKAICKGETAYQRGTIDDSLCVAYRPLIEHARAALLAPFVERTAAAYELVRQCGAYVETLRRKQRCIFFSGIPVALNRLLEAVPDESLAHRMDSRIVHLLLDEFQDTSPLQWRILKRFADGIAGGDSNGSLFVVGDPKQSIYGWRGAEASIFGHLADDYPDMGWESNDLSHRSSQVVLDTVSDVFGRLSANSALVTHVATAQRWQEQFNAPTEVLSQGRTSGRPGYALLVESPAPVVDNDGGGDGQGGEAGADDDRYNSGDPHVNYVADMIAKMAEEAQGRTIGVLTRRNDTARDLLFALSTRDVRATGANGGLLAADPAAGIVLAAMRLADHPADSAAAFQVIHSPLAPLVGLDGTDRSALYRASSSIRDALTINGYGQTVAAWSRVLADHTDARGAVRLARLVEIADAYDRAPSLRPVDFVAIASAAEVEEPFASTVRVMTIHRAKGLEFDAVVLPDLNGELLKHRPAFYREYDARTGETARVFRYAKKEIMELDPALRRMREQHTARELHDAFSVLYVGMTRAKHSLVMVAKPLSNRFSLAKILTGALCTGEPTLRVDGGKALFEKGTSLWHEKLPKIEAPVEQMPREETAIATGAPATRREWRLTSPSSLETGYTSARQILCGSSREARQTGTVLHSFFQAIGWLDDGEPDDAVLIAAARAAVPDVPDSSRAAHVALFRDLVRSSPIRRLLSRPVMSPGNAIDLWREREFAVPVGDRILRGAFDRVVVTRRGGKAIRVEITDFKTDDVSATAEVDRAVQRYKPQIGAYREALCAMLGLPLEAVTAKLAFVRAGLTMEILCAGG